MSILNHKKIAAQWRLKAVAPGSYREPFVLMTALCHTQAAGTMTYFSAVSFLLWNTSNCRFGPPHTGQRSGIGSPAIT